MIDDVEISRSAIFLYLGSIIEDDKKIYRI